MSVAVKRPFAFGTLTSWPPATCRSGVHGTATIHAGTLYKISANQVRRAILNGGAYVNIHTTKNYNWGEIRGQIHVAK